MFRKLFLNKSRGGSRAIRAEGYVNSMSTELSPAVRGHFMEKHLDQYRYDTNK